MAIKQEHTVALKERQIQYLDRMVEKYGLPDRGKAIRILVDFAMHETDDEKRIFEDTRCSGC